MKNQFLQKCVDEWVNWLLKGLVVILISIVGFFIKSTYDKVLNLEVELVQLRVDLARMKFLSTEDVKEICRTEILKFHHNIDTKSGN